MKFDAIHLVDQVGRHVRTLRGEIRLVAVVDELPSAEDFQRTAWLNLTSQTCSERLSVKPDGVEFTLATPAAAEVSK